MGIYGGTTASMTVVNAGTIKGNPSLAGGKGIEFAGGGGVTNQTFATISGYNGIYGGSGASMTITNSGGNRRAWREGFRHQVAARR